MANEYNPKEIESKWQKKWEEDGIYEARGKGDKYYSLIEFPYPSGDGLHVGHPRPYIGMDVVSRKRRMEGFDVLYPIGWDAFGLPTENYAIKTGKQPAVITKENTDTFRRQIKSLGISFDWSREVNTTDPKYYKWTQWLFLKFLEHGLAYKAKALINWCPKDKIGLANEEVVDGKCEKCGTPVEQKEKEQWMLAITKYAERLLKDLDEVDYPERVKAQQRNWIGKSEGAEIEFIIEQEVKPNFIILHGYTGRADTNFIPNLKKELDKKGYKVQAPQLPNTDKPTEEEQVNYVLENCEIDENTIMVGHSLGAIVAMKAILKRDKLVKGFVLVAPAKNPSVSSRNKVYHKTFSWDFDYEALKKLTEWRLLMSDLKEESRIEYLNDLSKKLDARVISTMAVKEHFCALEEPFILEHLFPSIKVFTTRPDTIFGATFLVVAGKEDKFTGKYVTNPATKEKIPVWEAEYVMGDYGTGAIMGVPADDERDKLFAEKHKLPIVEGYKKDGFENFGKKVIKYKLRDWIFSRQRYWGEPIPVIHCEKCGVVPVPEKDLPVELPPIDKYEPTDTGESPLANVSDWVNTTCPKCSGKAKRETDVMPNWAGSSWYFYRYTDPQNHKEFASKKALKHWMPVDWYNGGMEHTTLHLLYSRFWNKFLFDIGLVPTSEPYKKRTSHGMVVASDGEKMSKSRDNVVSPDSIVERFGADTLRLYEMFMGPFEQAIAWNDDALVGPRRFLERVWKESHDLTGTGNEILMNQTIKKVSQDIETLGFNTAISSLMIWLNGVEKFSTKEFEIFLKLLAPFAPHLAEELWSMNHKTSIHTEAWPKYDENKLVEIKSTFVVQINGRARASFVADSDIDGIQASNMAKKISEVQKWLTGKDVKGHHFVPRKLINIVTN